MSAENVMTQALLTPFQLGPHLLTNRIAMAPLTRMRSLAGNTPGARLTRSDSPTKQNSTLMIRQHFTEATLEATQIIRQSPENWKSDFIVLPVLFSPLNLQALRTHKTFPPS